MPRPARIWRTDLSGCPSQSWAFVSVQDNAYGLFLSYRPGCDGWRASVIPNARRQEDLYETRWSADVFVEAGLVFREDQLVEAQAALVRLLAGRLGVTVKEIAVDDGQPRLTSAQIHQIAKLQPRRR